jgi:AcrR family transcriptional regulator
MGVVERRERERQETRQLILDAARELFVAEGHEAVSMRKVAEKIEYSPTAIYHHFRDKQALIEELCLHDFRSLAAAFLSIGRVEDPVERIRRIGAAYVDFALGHPSQYRFMFMTAGLAKAEQPPEVRGNPQEDAYAFLRHTVSEAIEAGRFRDRYRDPEMTSQMLWATMHGIVSLHIIHGHEDDWFTWRDARQTAAAMSQAMLDGMVREAGNERRGTRNGS